jgi:N-acetylneuraminic acid mutarotase
MSRSHTPTISERHRELMRFKQSALGKKFDGDILKNPQEALVLLQEKKKQMYSILQHAAILRMLPRDQPEETTARSRKDVLSSSVRKSTLKKKSTDSSRKASVRYSSTEPKMSVTPIPEDAIAYWALVETEGWRPEARQSATFTTISQKIYLIGGIGRAIYSEMYWFNHVNKRWTRVENKAVEPDPRFGHTAVENDRNIVLFGGATSLKRDNELRQCLNTVKIFKPETEEWEVLKTGGLYLSTRKHHCTTIVGRHLFIHGGLNDRNNLLQDSAILSFHSRIWKAVEATGTPPGPRAFHTALAILPDEARHNTSIKLYNVSNFSSSGIKEVGIYIFGGIDEKREPTNSLYILKLGSKPAVWLTPSTLGSPPSPRFLHTMTFIPSINSIAIFGGRVDNLNSPSYTSYNDIYLLTLENLTWTYTHALGNIPCGRSGHSASALGTRLYIFGGMANGEYCNSEIYMLELNQSQAKFLSDEERKRQEYLKRAHRNVRKINWGEPATQSKSHIS